MSGLAEILAAAGGMYGGYTGAEMADTGRRRQLQAEQQAALQLAAAQRDEDFRARAASGLADFLPSGAKATTVQTQEIAPDDQAPSGFQDAGPAAVKRYDNRAGALDFMREAAIKSGNPDRAMEIDKRLRAYKDEGLLDTARAIASGQPDDVIRDTFNASGRVKLASVKRLDKSRIVGVTEDGRQVQFDASQMMGGLLSPDQFKRDESREEVTQARLSEGNWKSEAARAKAENDRIKAEAYRDRMSRLGGPAGSKPVDPAKERAERRRWQADVERYARDEATSIDPESGAKVVDSDRLNQIAGLSALLVQEQPDLLSDPRGTAQAASMRLEELKAKAGDKATREWGGMAEGAGEEPGAFEGVTSVGGGREGKQAYIQRRTQEIVKGLMRNARSSGPAAPGDDMAALAQGSFGAYEPDKYEYRVGPKGNLQRKAK